LGRRPLGAILHSSNEPGELSQWICHDDSTINIVVLIIIIIIIDALSVLSAQLARYMFAIAKFLLRFPKKGVHLKVG